MATMTRLFDNYFDRPEIYNRSRSAILLDIEAMWWSNRRGTDGVVTRADLRRFTSSDNAEAEAAELVEAGVWQVTDDGWKLDWSAQWSAERVAEYRKKEAAKAELKRDRKGRHDEGDHSMCSPKYCAELQAMHDAGDHSMCRTYHCDHGQAPPVTPRGDATGSRNKVTRHRGTPHGDDPRITNTNTNTDRRESIGIDGDSGRSANAARPTPRVSMRKTADGKTIIGLGGAR